MRRVETLNRVGLKQQLQERKTTFCHCCCHATTNTPNANLDQHPEGVQQQHGPVHAQHSNSGQVPAAEGWFMTAARLLLLLLLRLWLLVVLLVLVVLLGLLVCGDRRQTEQRHGLQRQ